MQTCNRCKTKTKYGFNLKSPEKQNRNRNNPWIQPQKSWDAKKKKIVDLLPYDCIEYASFTSNSLPLICKLHADICLILPCSLWNNSSECEHKKKEKKKTSSEKKRQKWPQSMPYSYTKHKSHSNSLLIFCQPILGPMGGKMKRKRKKRYSTPYGYLNLYCTYC